MRLGGEVDDEVGRGDETVDERGVGDVAAHQLDVLPQPVERSLVARIRHGVENDDARLWALLHRQVDEVAADEAGSAGDQDLHPASIR